MTHPTPNLTAKAEQAIVSVCNSYNNKPDTLLEILHDVQEKLGHVPEQALPLIAEALNLSR